MIIFEVINKVSSVLFVSEKDAENYFSANGSASNSLWIQELYVVDDTEQANKPVEPTASKEPITAGMPFTVRIGRAKKITL